MQYTLKKSLGQHFLKDETVCKKIILALQQHQFKNLLEIGAGGGALTKYLVPIENIYFKTVELDDEKIMYLQKTFPQLEGKIIHEDFLKVTIPFEDDFAVIGNFPYNISSQILFKILEWKKQVPLLIGMFQKEVAQRVSAKSGNKQYGILSVLVQAFYNVEYLFDVSPVCFVPPPKVVSGIIKLQRKNTEYEMRSEKDFFILVKTAFNQRRKTLRNATRNLFNEIILQEEIFNQRAEQLTVEQFATLTFKMK